MKISKHKTTHILCCALCAAAAIFSSSLMSSCADGIDAPDQGQKEGYITLSLSNSRLSSSRAEDATNEFLINKALVCFFVGDAPTDDALPAYANVFTINLYDQADIKITLTDELLNTLFPGESTEATAYVIANLDGNVPASGKNPDVTQALGMTLSELKSLAIESDFASMEHQASFVMDGQSVLALDSDPQKNPAHSSVSGTVNLQRAAAKIMLSIKLIDTVTDGAGETWKSMPADMKVIISNGVKKSNVTPNPAAVADGDRYSTVMVNPDNDSYSARGFTKNEAEGSEYPYELDSPFYTYPTQWDANPTSLGEDMTYLQLMVPWEMQKKNADTGELEPAGIFRTCYYAIPVLQTENVIARNVAYQININVNILGTFRPEQPEILDASYRAVNWGEAPVDVEIQDYRYLVLNQSNYVMNNASEIEIQFYSSHETTIKNVDFKYYLYNMTTAGLEEEITVTEAQNEKSTTKGVIAPADSTYHMYSRWIDNKINDITNSRLLYFKHFLYQWQPKTSSNGNVNLGPAFPDGDYNNLGSVDNIDHYALINPMLNAYCRYEIVITIVHTDKIGEPDERRYTQTVNITQYPAMSITADANKFITYQNQPYGVAAYGNVYINGTTNTGTSGAQMTPSGLTGGNRNPNMYIVTTTQLNNNRYILGDPRSTTSNLLSYDNWTNAPAIGETTDRKLQHYYPADASDAKKFYIAPKLRIASSYGVSSTYSKDVAQRRCAGYQELNCPAGRWRLPTYGELEYIINLSNNGMIPVLFSDDSRYWCVQGSVLGKVTNGQLGTTSAVNSHVRCVYDEWYWGDSKVPQDGTKTVRMNNTNYTVENYPFTWGDKEINFTTN